MSRTPYYQSHQETLDSFKLWERILSPLPVKENKPMEQANGTIKATVNTSAQYGQEEDYNPFLADGVYVDSNTNARVDMTTGEVLNANTSLTPLFPIDQELEVMLPPTSTPRYLKALSNIPEMEIADKAALLSVYDTPVKMKSFKEYLNQDVTLYGAIVHTHPDYTSLKEKNEDGTPKVMPGYDQIRLLAYENNEPVIIFASYGALAVHIEGLLSLQGWYLWNEPVTYKFSQDLKTNGFRMTNVARVAGILSKMKKDSTKK